MSAFIDPKSTEVIDLPACYCPAEPHDHDSVTIRSEYSYGDIVELARATLAGGRIDPMAGRPKLLQLALAAWSFVDAAGQPVPVTIDNILLLRQDVIEPVVARVDELYQSAQASVPNGSSGPSLDSLPGTGPQNRAQRRAAKRSTPKSSSAPAGPIAN